MVASGGHMEALTCEKCGGELAQQQGNDLYFCQYCGTTFTRAAVAQRLEGLAGLQIDGSLSADQLMQKGLMMLELGIYDKARAVFQQVTDSCPQDYRGWWYIFLCDTKSLTEIHPDKDALYKTAQLEYALRFAPREVQPDLLRQYRAYAQQCMKMGCEAEMVQVANECSQLDGILATLQIALANAQKKIPVFKRGWSFIIAGIISFFVGFAFFPLGPLILLGLPFVALGFLLVILGIVDMAALIRAGYGYLSLRKIETQKREIARLAELKRAKQGYLQELQAYVQALPKTMEKLTISDILNDKRRIA